MPETVGNKERPYCAKQPTADITAEPDLEMQSTLLQHPATATMEHMPCYTDLTRAGQLFTRDSPKDNGAGLARRSLEAVAACVNSHTYCP